MKGKTVVAFASKSGVTEEAATLIAKTLRDNGIETELVNLRKDKKFIASAYDNVVVGGAVRCGKIYGEVENFFKRNNLSKKKAGLFIVSGGGGDPKEHDSALEKYNGSITRQFSDVNFVSNAAFGGMMKIFGKTVFDNRDPEKVRKWAEELSIKLKK
ncbi:MAG: hypothetical protein JW716_00305 [Candidatus Aenigmarchaeota archaeon]|nr:hypothetical protein [Candidatus Aenigmarchaeota archaeon]